MHILKNFEIISDELFAVEKAGFELDFDYEYEENFTESYSENRKSCEIDSFYDLDNAALCVDENGVYYAVEFHLVDDEMKPIIWQRVKRVE